MYDMYFACVIMIAVKFMGHDCVASSSLCLVHHPVCQLLLHSETQTATEGGL